jgi:hypothetical protein
MDAMFCFKQAMEVLQAIENELEVTTTNMDGRN